VKPEKNNCLMDFIWQLLQENWKSTFLSLPLSGTEEVKSYENGLTFCTADETTLKTMIRANPGYICLKTVPSLENGHGQMFRRRNGSEDRISFPGMSGKIN